MWGPHLSTAFMSVSIFFAGSTHAKKSKIFLFFFVFFVFLFYFVGFVVTCSLLGVVRVLRLLLGGERSPLRLEIFGGQRVVFAAALLLEAHLRRDLARLLLGGSSRRLCLCVAGGRSGDRRRHLERRLFSVAQGVPALAEEPGGKLALARVGFALLLAEQHEAAEGLLGSVRVALLLDARLARLLAALARSRGGGGNAQRSHLLRERLELLGELVDLEGKGLDRGVGGRHLGKEGCVYVCGDSTTSKMR